MKWFNILFSGLQDEVLHVEKHVTEICNAKSQKQCGLLHVTCVTYQKDEVVKSGGEKVTTTPLCGSECVNWRQWDEWGMIGVCRHVAYLMGEFDSCLRPELRRLKKGI